MNNLQARYTNATLILEPSTTPERVEQSWNVIQANHEGRRQDILEVVEYLEHMASWQSGQYIPMDDAEIERLMNII